MTDLDIAGIEDILQQAARIRADISKAYDTKPAYGYTGTYSCSRCGDENSVLSAWCIRCGLRKNDTLKVCNNQHEKSENIPESIYTVYNTDQILNDIIASDPVKAEDKHEPRGINKTKGFTRGEVIIYNYAQSTECNESFSKSEVSSPPEEDTNKTIEDVPSFFGSEDIILYDRGDNKKNKKKLYIKPLSTPSLLQTDTVKIAKNAWSPPILSKQNLRSSDSKVILNSRPSTPAKGSRAPSQIRAPKQIPLARPTAKPRPNSASRSTAAARPNSKQIVQPNPAYQRNNNCKSSVTRPSSAKRHQVAKSATPAVFERLYSNEARVRAARSVHSSPHLLADSGTPLKTSTVGISANLSLQTSAKTSSKDDERHLVSRKKRSHNTFPKQMCASPLTVNGVRTSLPAKYPLKAYYRVQVEVEWMSLPAELWVKIMRYMTHKDLCELSVTCSYLHQLTTHTAIWDSIIVSGRELQDCHVQVIGEKRPKHLTFRGCNGEYLSTMGLRALFRGCGDTLKSLTVTDCKGGDLVSSSLLLHLSARCQNLTQLHLSLCNLTDEALTQLAQRTQRLERLCIPMCSGITDLSFRVLLSRHHTTFTCLDITGCYYISASAIAQISLCPSLTALYLGNCNQINSSTLTTLAEKCHKLLVLDIRGCRNVSSDSLITLLAANPHIHTLSISHLTIITDAVLEKICSTLLRLHVLDVSGCIKVTSMAMQYLVKHPLKALDLGSTAIGYRGCCAIANYLSSSIQQISFNFCSDINDECIRKIAQKCKKLRQISIFGCSYIRNFDVIAKINPHLLLEF